MPRPREFDEETVLSTARDQFWTTGYAGTSVDVLAKAVGLGKGSLYGAFGGKRQLFHRVFDGYCTQAVDAAKRDLSGPDEDAFDRLTAYLHGIADASADPDRRGCMLAKGTAELAQHDPVVAARSHRTLQELRLVFADEIEACRRHGDVDADADPDRLAGLLLALHRGLEALGKAGADAGELHAVAETALALVSRSTTPTNLQCWEQKS